jgi:uncharacterized protein with PQ loop repeat
MSGYDIFGSLNSFFILLSLLGIFSQLRKVWRRKQQVETQRCPTELLSLNQFSVSFLAYFCFFVYGYSIQPFNHFLVWPRGVAALLVGFILFEIWRDRKTHSALVVCMIAVAAFMLGLLGLYGGGTYSDEGKFISTCLIVVITLLLAQGYYHQIKLIWHSGKTGAVDLKMSQFILLMDVSTIAFALTMGLDDGWPLILLATTSGITKLLIMYLFRWVRVSPLACQRSANYGLGSRSTVV